MTDRKTELFKIIEYHNKLYWIDNNPQISDIDYDKLVREYINLGGKLEDFQFKSQTIDNKYVHQIPMLSLDKGYSHDDVLKWCEKVCRSKKKLY